MRSDIRVAARMLATRKAAMRRGLVLSNRVVLSACVTEGNLSPFGGVPRRVGDVGRFDKDYLFPTAA
jgi:hypothetical protein